MAAAVDTDLFSKPSLDFASFCFSLVNILKQNSNCDISGSVMQPRPEKLWRR